MTDIVQLHVVPTAPKPPRPGDSQQSYLDGIKAFLLDHSILGPYEDTDVTLSPPAQDEELLGPLTSFERECFIMSELVKEVSKLEMINIQADVGIELATIMRDNGVTMPEAVNLDNEAKAAAGDSSIPPDTLDFLSQCGAASALLAINFQWSLRARLNRHQGNVVIRSGFIAYLYG